MSTTRVKFDEFEVDPANFQLRRSGSLVQIERIPMELLLILIEKRGQLVNRAEIFEKIWGKDVFLDADSAVSTAVRKLRRALGDDASSPKYVETVVAKGYRFIASVQQNPPAGGAFDDANDCRPEPVVSMPAAMPARVRSYQWAAITAAAAVVLALAMGGWLSRSPKTYALTNRDTIVLADFANSTGDPVFDDALKQGLSEESRAEAYFGRLKRSRELSRHAEDAALGRGDKTTAAEIEATAAFVEALFGDSAGARGRAAAALSLWGRTPVASARAGDSVQPAVALALAGDSALAAKVADSLASDAPEDGVTSRVWLPEIRAAIELKRSRPARAVDLLTPVTPYEAGWSDNFLAAYLLGEAYLAERAAPRLRRNSSRSSTIAA